MTEKNKQEREYESGKKVFKYTMMSLPEKGKGVFKLKVTDGKFEGREAILIETPPRLAYFYNM